MKRKTSEENDVYQREEHDKCNFREYGFDQLISYAVTRFHFNFSANFKVPSSGDISINRQTSPSIEKKVVLPH